jgi:hypothetical protein
MRSGERGEAGVMLARGNVGRGRCHGYYFPRRLGNLGHGSSAFGLSITILGKGTTTSGFKLASKHG